MSVNKQETEELIWCDGCHIFHLEDKVNILKRTNLIVIPKKFYPLFTRMYPSESESCKYWLKTNLTENQKKLKERFDKFMIIAKL